MMLLVFMVDGLCCWYFNEGFCYGTARMTILCIVPIFNMPLPHFDQAPIQHAPRTLLVGLGRARAERPNWNAQPRGRTRRPHQGSRMLHERSLAQKMGGQRWPWNRDTGSGCEDLRSKTATEAISVDGDDDLLG